MLSSYKRVKIWDGIGSKEFLESRGLGHRRQGDFGPVYGFQWRHFGATYVDCERNYIREGVDQLGECIRRIREDLTDRRIIYSAWNPKGLLSILTFCKFRHRFSTDDGSSALPYNVSILHASFFRGSALPTHMIVLLTGTDAHELIIQLGDAHVYLDHVEAIEQQLKRSTTVPMIMA
jgi:thymidylate synthase